jgi:hypothetical protein
LGRGQSTAAAAVVVATTIVISLQQQAHLLFGELLVFLPTDMAVSSSTVKKQLANPTEHRASHTAPPSKTRRRSENSKKTKDSPL